MIIVSRQDKCNGFMGRSFASGCITGHSVRISMWPFSGSFGKSIVQQCLSSCRKRVRFRTSIKLIISENPDAGNIGKLVIYFGLNSLAYQLQIILRDS